MVNDEADRRSVFLALYLPETHYDGFSGEEDQISGISSPKSLRDSKENSRPPQEARQPRFGPWLDFEN